MEGSAQYESYYVALDAPEDGPGQGLQETGFEFLCHIMQAVGIGSSHEGVILLKSLI